MQIPTVCRTRELASVIAAVTGMYCTRRPPVWAATFESYAMFSSIRELATSAGGGQAQVFVVMDGGDGYGQAYSLGIADQVRAAIPVDDGAFPLAGRAPDGDVLLIRIEGLAGEAGSMPKVRVTSYRDGLRHGFVPASPAEVESQDGNMSGAYYVAGRDVTNMVFDPARTALETLQILGRPDLERHASLAAIIAAAEDKQEAVILRIDALPGVALVRAPGAPAYSLVADEDTGRLQREWDPAVPVLQVSFQDAGRRCVSIRRLHGLVDGTCGTAPATCISTEADGVVAMKTTLLDSTRAFPAEQQLAADSGGAFRR